MNDIPNNVLGLNLFHKNIITVLKRKNSTIRKFLERYVKILYFCNIKINKF